MSSFTLELTPPSGSASAGAPIEHTPNCIDAGAWRLTWNTRSRQVFRDSANGWNIIAFAANGVTASDFNLSLTDTLFQTIERSAQLSIGNWTIFAYRQTTVIIRPDFVGLVPLVQTNTPTSTIITSDRTHPDIPNDAAHSRIALNLCYPGVPYGLDESDPRGSLSYLRPGAYYETTPTWPHLEKARAPQVPRVELQLPEASDLLRQQLLHSISSINTDEAVGADLSGGYDSTTLCFALDHTKQSFTAYSSASRHPGSQDTAWANWASTQLKYATHTLWDPMCVPLPFEQSQFSQPFTFIGYANAARIEWTAQSLRNDGITLHIGGHGGDELFGLSEHYVHDRILRAPLKTLTAAMEFMAKDRWRPIDLAHMVGLGGSKSATLKSFIAQLEAPPNTLSTHPDRWNLGSAHMPEWVTPEFVTIARRHLIEHLPAVMTSRWLDHAHGLIVDSARTTSTIIEIFAAEGVSLRLPYFDEAIVRTALATAPEQAFRPLTPKSLLAKSMAPICGDTLYKRRTKDSGLPDVYQGWRLNRGRLRSYLLEGELVKLGAITADTIGQALQDRLAQPVQPVALWRTLALENALRNTRLER